jgi:hypothetical protein
MGDHLIVMHSAVRSLPGYSRHEAPAILMDGVSVDRTSEHGRAVTAQIQQPHDTLNDALRAGVVALREAGIPQGIRNQARAASEDYFYERLKLDPGTPLNPHAPLPPSLEPLPDGMFKALENIVELVVDGEWDDLVDLSSGRLSAEDIRRRVEDDVPEALTLPPRSHYGVEAISRPDDLEPEDDGFAFFLDLWAEEAPARLHIVGALVLTADEQFLVALGDILP